MKNKLFFIFIFFTFLVNAQNGKVEKSQLKLNFLVPSIGYEAGLTDKTSITFEVGTGFSFVAGSNRDTEISFFPYFESQYKYYYNFEKRAKKGKRIANNSANYISFIAVIQSQKPLFKNSRYNDQAVFIAGPTWGFQRTYKKGFRLSLDLGVGYAYETLSNNSSVSPLIDIELGWVLNRKK